MKITNLLSIFISVTFAFSIPVSVFAQARQHRTGNRASDGEWRGRIYDPAKVDTVSGEVVEIQTVTGRGRRLQSGMHVILRTSTETISVHLGPTWFVAEQKVKLTRGDNIEVTGSRFDYRNNTTIVAKEIRKDNHVVTLRDDNGVPAWIGRGRR